MTIPYFPLSDEMLGGIVRLQLGRIGKRIARTTTRRFVYGDAVVDAHRLACATTRIRAGA